MTPADALRLAVSLLEQVDELAAAGEIAPLPTDVGPLPYGWFRRSLVAPTLADAPIVDLVHRMRGEGRGYGTVAQEINARGIQSARGALWSPNAVRRLERAHPQEARRRWTVPTVHRLL